VRGPLSGCWALFALSVASRSTASACSRGMICVPRRRRPWRRCDVRVESFRFEQLELHPQRTIFLALEEVDVDLGKLVAGRIEDRQRFAATLSGSASVAWSRVLGVANSASTIAGLLILRVGSFVAGGNLGGRWLRRGRSRVFAPRSSQEDFFAVLMVCGSTSIHFSVVLRSFTY